jgi:hypothetical protein
MLKEKKLLRVQTQKAKFIRIAMMEQHHFRFLLFTYSNSESADP